MKILSLGCVLVKAMKLASSEDLRLSVVSVYVCLCLAVALSYGTKLAKALELLAHLTAEHKGRGHTDKEEEDDDDDHNNNYYYKNSNNDDE